MAMVQYIVYYRYVHPNTKKPVTNSTTDKYTIDERFIKAYKTNDAVQSAQMSQDILLEQSPENTKYDMVFVYNGVTDIDPFVVGSVQANNKIYVEKFERCKGEVWFVASYHASLQSALLAAEPLVRSLGKENVRILKNVPIEISVGLE